MDNYNAGDNNLVNQGDNLTNSTFQASSSALSEVFQKGSLISDSYKTDTASKHLTAIDIWEGIPSKNEKNSEEKQQQKDKKKSDEDAMDKRGKYDDDATEIERMLRDEDSGLKTSPSP